MTNKKPTSIKAERGFLNPKVSNVFIEDATQIPQGISDDVPLGENPIDDFMKQPDFNINQVDQRASTKTNFYILNNNWVALVKYLKNIKSVIKWLYDSIQIDEIVKQVLDKLETSKNEIPVSFDIPVTTSYQIVCNKHTYKITRVDEYILTIECLTKPNWDVRNLIVSVKNNDNVIVYPAIQTVNNRIRVDFIDKIATNYRVIFI